MQTSPPTSTLGSLRALFDVPPRDFSPTPLWWWSAEKVTGDGIRRQLRNLCEGGVYNVVVINLAPSGPLFGAVVDDPMWFSDEWWKRFNDLCVAAAELEMRVWFYDQIGFSGANLQGRLIQHNPWAAGKVLRWHEATADAAGVLQGDVDLQRLVGVYTLPDAANPHGRRLSTTAGVLDDAGHVGPVQIVTWQPTAFDYLNPQATALLLDAVHGEFERRMGDRLGNVIAGSFQDELPATNSWTDTFAGGFGAAFGYDLLDELPALFRPQGERGAQVLHDYYSHRTELAEAALFEPLGQWHERHGMLLGADQFNPARAGWPTQTTQLYTDYFRTHRHYNAVGSDHEGDSKVHSSMAHLYDHPRTWLESFHSSGWGGTLQDTYDWLLPFLRSGANLYNPHAVYYGTAGGWFEWAPPSTDWRQPYWGQYKSFANAVARICSMMTWGNHACSVAVLYPSATSQSTLPLDSPVDHFRSGQIGEPYGAADQAQRVYLELAGTNNWWRTNPGALNSAAIDFDVVDDSSLQAADVAPGALVIGHERYAAVLLPATRYLEQATAKALLRLLDSGGRVLVVEAEPASVAGSRGRQRVVDELLIHPALERFPSTDKAVAALGDHRVIGSDLPSLVRRGDDGTSVAFLPSAHPNASAYPLRGEDSWFWADFDFDASRYRSELTVHLPADTRWAEAWNPATGARTPLELSRGEDASAVSVPFAGAPALLLVWSNQSEPDALPSKQTSATTLQLDGPWSYQVVPTLDNTFAEYDRPAHPGPVPYRMWSLEHAETASGEPPQQWARTRATYGVHGIVVEPDGTSSPWSYSDSRGIEKDITMRGLLGAKGRVPDGFVLATAAYGSEHSRYRTFVRLPETGSHELVLGATAAKRVWVDDVLVHDDVDASAAPFLVRIPVTATSPLLCLEYELGAAEGNGTFLSPPKPEHQPSFFAFTHPGHWPAYPEYVRPRDRSGTPAAGRVTFSRTIEVPEDVQRARVVVGAACAVEVLIDGRSAGRQEMAQWYETDWGASPQHFVHDLTALLTSGAHRVEIRLEAPTSDVVLFVDLVLELADGTVIAVVSDDSWQVDIGSGPPTSSVPTRRSWGENANLHLASRPHPLAGAQWLTGAPQIGQDALRVDTTDSLEERTQWLRFRLPAGSRAVDIPTRLQLSATLDGGSVPLVPTAAGYRIDLPEATRAPAELVLISQPTAFGRGGAGLDGPLELSLEPSQTQLLPWSEIGLDWLSGGVAYTRQVDLAEQPTEAVLHLGSVRGHVRLVVNGTRAADLFCTPWSWDIASHLQAGTNTLEVQVFNTLGPYLDDVTPTRWVFPSQKRDGLFGPVTLTVR